MNLVILTAVIAVCGAAKLDRTYLPPSSAANAGGPPGSLQTPLARSSVQGLETPRLPSGSYTNDFGGVVVDAASPGTRASVDADQSNLGGPRPSYGSTDSKVGDAAFRGTAGFRDASFGSQGQTVPESLSNSQIDAHNGQFSSQNSNGQYSNGQVSSFENKSERPQAAKDRNSNILALSNDVDADRYSYGFETDNGIAVGENGVAVNGIQAEGGYSYQGDDGQVYKVTYTADEGGYRPQGAHLPTPPPIPEEILKSLEQNAKEEAAGIVDDGSYDAQKYNTEGDYTNDNSGNIQHNGGQLSLFGKRPESDATASGSFINQNGQAFRQPALGQINSDNQNSHFNSQSSQSNGGSEQFGIAGTQNSGFAFNGQSSQGNGNSAFKQFGSQSPFVAESSQTNEKPGKFGASGTQNNQQSSQGNSHHGSAQHQNTQALFNGQINQGSVPQKDASSSHNSGTLSAQYSGNIQNIQIPGNHIPSSSPQGQSSFGGFNNFGSHASASAQAHNQLPNSESQQTQQGFNTQLSSEPKPEMTQPQFGSSFKPQGSEAFSGASLDQEQDGQDFGKPSPQTFSGLNFNRPSTPTGQVQANKFVSGTNNFNKISQSSSQTGGKTEYLPPTAGQQQPEQLQASNGFNSNVDSSGSFNAGSNFNSQISGFNKPTPNFNPLNRQKPSLASASASTSFGLTRFQAQPARPLNAFNSQAVASQPKPNQFTQQSSRFGQQDQFSSQKPQFNANSQQSGSFSQTGQEQLSFGTKPTSIPDTELTTPLEPNETPAYSQGSQISSHTTASFANKPTSNTQTQPQFGFQGNYAFGQQSSQSISSSFPTTTPSALQSSSVGNKPKNRKPQLSQNSFAQKQSSSNQGADSSYYYNQPSQPFGLTANRPQTPRFPSSSSYQSNGIASQNIDQQNSFSGKLPGSQSLAPVAPTAASQFNQQQNYNGITQAAISSFSSPSPTPSQLGTTYNNQFGSKPTFNQQSFGNQGQTLKPVFNQQTTFGSKFQTSGSQQSKPTFAQSQSGFSPQPVSQFGQKPSSEFQTQNKFGQSGQFEESLNTPGFSTTSEEKPTITQQYQGTIYEYNKPAQVLPVPTQTDSSSSQSIQSGITVETKPSFAQQSNQFTQQNQVSESDSKSDTQIKPFASASANQFGHISQSQQANKLGSQSGLTNNQFGNTAQASQFGSSPQQQNMQVSQQRFEPFGFNSHSSFGLKPQSGSQTSQFKNTQTLVNSQISQPVRGSSQSQFGLSMFGNAAASQNNGYFYPNPTSQFPENPQSTRLQSAPNQNTQNPFAQALFTASEQTGQSQFNSNFAPEFSAQSSQTDQNAAQFSQKSPYSPIKSFGQSTASSQAVASGQATATASTSLPQPQYKPFGSQDRNQFSPNKNDVQGQSTQQVAVQNVQTARNPQSDDSLKPYGALNSRPGTSTAELPKPLFSSACCQASKDSTPAQSADAPSQSGFQGAQNFNAQSFVGKGEEFGGPRQPPKFDETGYHY